jgi:hypothetical protein
MQAGWGISTQKMMFPWPSLPKSTIGEGKRNSEAKRTTSKHFRVVMPTLYFNGLKINESIKL